MSDTEKPAWREADITINGVKLDHRLSMAVRMAIAGQLMELSDLDFCEALGVEFARALARNMGDVQKIIFKMG